MLNSKNRAGGNWFCAGVRRALGIAPWEILPTSVELASLGSSSIFEQKARKSFYKVKDHFVNKIISSYFIYFVSLCFCMLGLVKAKHTHGKNKSTLLCGRALSSLLFCVIKIQCSIQMCSVYVETVNVCWGNWLFSRPLSVQLLHCSDWSSHTCLCSLL